MNSKTETNIYGMTINNYSFLEVVKIIIDKANKNSNFMVVTPNVDHFLRWQSNAEFRKLYNFADLKLIDGMPILWLAKLLHSERLDRITGVDLTLALLEIASAKKLALSIIGGSEETLNLAKLNIQKRYPGIDLFFTTSPTAVQLKSEDYLKNLSLTLRNKEKKIVLLCLGSPKQERLYADLLERHDLSGVYLCVGATIDFIAGKKKRAPKLVQKIGFEWLYRFGQEPVRLFRRYFITGIGFLPFLLKALIQTLINKKEI